MVSTEMTSSESRDCLRTAISFSPASKSIYSKAGEKKTRTGIKQVDSDPVPEQTGSKCVFPRSITLPERPVSSFNSRSAASSADSPSSINPSRHHKSNTPPPGNSMQYLSTGGR